MLRIPCCTAHVVLPCRYGSVIFFNVRQRTREAWLDMLKPYIKVPERQGNIDSSSSSSSREAAAKPALRTDGELTSREIVV